MTFETVHVHMLRPYRAYRTGQVVAVTPGLARTLELQGYASRHLPGPQLEFAIAPEPAAIEVAVAPVAKAKRPRRRTT